MGEDAGQSIAPATINIAQFAAELAQGLAALRLGLGRGEIGNRLGLQQVELAVEKGAAGEFAGLGEPRPEPGECLHDRSEHSSAAVQMELHDILAGRAPRPRKPQDQPLIEHLSALRIDEAPPLRDARRRQPPASSVTALRASGPERRSTATAARPAAVAGAKIVSAAGSFNRIEYPLRAQTLAPGGFRMLMAVCTSSRTAW